MMFILMLMMFLQETSAPVDVVAQKIHAVPANERLLVVGTVKNVGGKAYRGAWTAKLYCQITPSSSWVLLRFDNVPFLSPNQTFSIKEYEPKGTTANTRYLLTITGQDGTPAKEVIIVPKSKLPIVKPD